MSALRSVLREHPRHVVLFGVVAGMAAAVWTPWALLPCALAAVAAAGRAPIAAAAVAAVLAGAWLADARRDAVDGGRLPVRAGERLAADVVLLEPLRTRASGERVARAEVLIARPLDLTGPEAVRDGRREPVLLRVPPGVAAPTADAGRVLRVRGRLGPLAPFEALQRRRGALAGLDVHALSVTGTRGGMSGALDGVRRRAEDALAAGLPADRAALVHGMVLGRDERIASGVRAEFEASGLAHLLAASGSNVILLATLVLAAGALGGVPLRWRLALAIVLIGLYVPVAGGGPSIQRAGVMGAAGLVAALAGRPASRWYALGLAAAITLALNPYALAEPGWQLSFAAVAGLLAWAGRLRERLEMRRVPRPVAEVAAMTLAATVATAPLMVLHFDRVSLMALPANLAAAPAVAPVMWLGTIAAVGGQIGLATPLSALAGVGAAYVGWVAEVSAAVPGASPGVELPPAAVATMCVVAVVCAWGRGRGWLARAGRVLAGGRAEAERRPGAVVVLVVAVALIVLSVMVPGRGAAPPAPGETVVWFLDVGQGDATLIRRDGAALLVDTGPPDGSVVDRVRDAGVRRLDALLITHAQSDHEGAALDVVRRLRPRVVVNGGAGWPTPVQRGLRAAAARAGSRIAVAAAGDAIRVGALELRLLWPPRALLLARPEGDPNERALVAHLRSGDFDLLLPADAESHVTTTLSLPRVEALKVAHHGSADELLPVLLERTRPAIAAIEVGRGNTYGHPAPSTLSALRSVPHVRRTDRDGTIELRVSPAGAMRLEAAGTLR